MSIITLHTRSFHPDSNFGADGLGFEGDSRGFSADVGASARIYHRVPIDLKSARLLVADCDSDPSSNSALKSIGINMSNNYTQSRKKPRHNEVGSVTKFRDDGDQSINVKIKYAGKNFAFFKSDTDTGHKIFGGEVSDGGSNTDSGSIIPWGDKWSGVVPDLDVTNELSMRINRSIKKATISCSISGDGFPNCESFLIDSSKNVLFLASHVRVGTAMTQLPGGRAISMCRTVLEVDWLSNETFGNNVSIQFAYDFSPGGGPADIASGTMSRTQWNNRHTKRDASGPTIRQLRDHIPMPTLISPAY